VAIKPAEIVARAADVGTYKAELDLPNLLVRGFMAGMFIAMGATLATVCGTGVASQSTIDNRQSTIRYAYLN
jgi:formate/nitrite transporter FocA (FNT family)